MQNKQTSKRPIENILAASAIVLLLLIGCGFFLGRLSPREPAYKGRSLSEWIGDLSNPELRPSAQDAICNMGTNSWHHLVTMLGKRDTPARERLVSTLRMLGFKKVHYSLTENFQAVEVFRILGTNASPAVPELIKMIECDWTYRAEEALGAIGEPAIPALLTLLTNSNPRVRSAAVSALGWAGPKAETAVPDLLIRLEDEKNSVRFAAAAALGQINRQGGLTQDAQRIIPALAKLLDDPSEVVRWNAVAALSTFDSNAKSVVPLLIASTRDPNEIVRKTSTNALLKIAPEALNDN